MNCYGVFALAPDGYMYLDDKTGGPRRPRPASRSQCALLLLASNLIPSDQHQNQTLSKTPPGMSRVTQRRQTWPIVDWC